MFSIQPKYGKSNIIELFTKILNMNDDEYCKYSMESYECVKNKFETIEIAKKILDRKNNKNVDKFLFLLNIYVGIDRARKKIRN